MAKRPREVQAARRALAVAERRLAALRARAEGEGLRKGRRDLAATP